MYFGRGHSIPSGSVVKLRLRNGTTIDLTWGVPRRELIRRQVIIDMTRKRHLKKSLVISDPSELSIARRYQGQGILDCPGDQEKVWLFSHNFNSFWRWHYINQTHPWKARKNTLIFGWRFSSIFLSRFQTSSLDHFSPLFSEPIPVVDYRSVLAQQSTSTQTTTTTTTTTR